MKNNVCSEELALKLNYLGVPQKSYFSYYLYPVQDNGNAPTHLHITTNKMNKETSDHCAAFTAEELWFLLPNYIKNMLLYVGKMQDNSTIVYYQALPQQKNEIRIDDQCDKFLVNALAKMLIYILENHL